MQVKKKLCISYTECRVTYFFNLILIIINTFTRITKQIVKYHGLQAQKVPTRIKLSFNFLRSLGRLFHTAPNRLFLVKLFESLCYKL